MPETDPTLSELVAECLEAVERNGPSAIEEFCSRCPEQASALRRRIQSLRNMGLLSFEEEDEGEEEREFPERLGDFALVERLGSGGMGVVYAAHDEKLGREVALKLIRPDQMYFPRARERFLREVRAVAKLQHPGIVPVYSVDEEQGIPFFAMERIHGCTLAEALDGLPGTMPPKGSDLWRAIVRHARGGDAPAEPPELFTGSWTEVALRISRSIAEALEHAHSRGIVHRDVKPSNVMIAPDGRTMLLDFGLSSDAGVDRMTRSGAVLGSAPYMAPEQVRSDSSVLSPASDVYSLGVTIYELLARRMPFDAQSAHSLRDTILAGDFLPLRRIASWVSWEAETVCAAAMELDTARRYSSAQELAEDLGNVLEHRPIKARRAGALLRLRRACQRRPARALSVLFAVAVLLGGPFTWAILSEKSRDAIRRKNDELEQTHATLEGTHASLEKAHGDLASTHTELEAAHNDLAIERDRVVEQRDLAQQSLGDALDAIETMLTEVANRFATESGSRLFQRTLLEEAVRLLDNLLENYRDVELVVIRSARALNKVGLIQKQLGEFAAARGSCDRALELLAEVDPENDLDPWKDMLESLSVLAQVASMNSDWDLVLRTQEQVNQLFIEKVPDEDLPQAVDAVGELTDTTSTAAAGLVRLGRGEDAIELLEEALAYVDLLREILPDSIPVLTMYAELLHYLGEACYYTSDVEGAEEAYTEAAAIAGELYELTDSSTHLIQRSTATSGLGTILMVSKRFEESLVPLRESVQLKREVEEFFPHTPHHRVSTASTLGSLAISLSRTSQEEEAYSTFEEAREILRDVVERQPDVAEYVATLAIHMGNLGWELATWSRVEESLATYEEAERLWDRARTLAPNDLQLTRDDSDDRWDHATVLHESGDLVAARSKLSEARALRARVAAQSGPAAEDREALQRIDANLNAWRDDG